MPLWQPTEDDSELMYIIAAALCWTGKLWYVAVCNRIVAPMHDWSWLTQLLA